MMYEFTLNSCSTSSRCRGSWSSLTWVTARQQHKKIHLGQLKILMSNDFIMFSFVQFLWCHWYKSSVFCDYQLTLNWPRSAWVHWGPSYRTLFQRLRVPSEEGSLDLEGQSPQSQLTEENYKLNWSIPASEQEEKKKEYQSICCKINRYKCFLENSCLRF